MPNEPLPLTAGRSAFGRNPSNYERARPAYPEALYARLFEDGALTGKHLFEIGPGPGTASLALLAHQPASLIAIEPDPRLATHLRTAAGTRFPQLDVLATSFGAAELPSESFDLGVAATSFHWLEPMPALNKILRLLRPGGRWAMWWNVFGDPDDPDPFQQASHALFQALPSSRTWQDGQRPFALDSEKRLAELRTAGFEHTRFELMRWTLWMDTSRVCALASTFSQVSHAPAPQREHFLAELGALVERNFGGRVERRFITALYQGRKRA